jgi:hypothetical protein
MRAFTVIGAGVLVSASLFGCDAIFGIHVIDDSSAGAIDAATEASDALPVADRTLPLLWPYPDGSVPPASASAADLTYNVVDAKLSTALSSLIILSDLPFNAVHLYDFATGADVSMPLPIAPKAIAVDATGTLAAVAYDAHVSWIDLRAQLIRTTCEVSSDASDVALTTAGIAYVAPADETLQVTLHVIDLTTCAETLAAIDLPGDTQIALPPSEKALFAAGTEETPDPRVCPLTTSVIGVIGCVEVGGDYWAYGYSVGVSADGTRLYTGGQATLLVPADPLTGTYEDAGLFPGVTTFQSFSEASQAGLVALLPSPQGSEFDPPQANADTVVRVHRTQDLSFVAQYELPTIPIGSPAGTLEHGKFVFSTQTMDALYVIAQREAKEDGGGGTFSVLKLALDLEGTLPDVGPDAQPDSTLASGDAAPD